MASGRTVPDLALMAGAAALAVYWLGKEAAGKLAEYADDVTAAINQAVTDQAAVVADPLAIQNPSFMQRLQESILASSPGLNFVWSANAVYEWAYRKATESAFVAGGGLFGGHGGTGEW